MSRPVFDPKELIPVGSYPPASHRGLAGAPKYDRPVTPRENLKLYFSGKKPYWLPYVGMASIDVLNFRPRIHPDNVATHLVIDGEGPMVYEQNTAIGWFGLEWVFGFSPKPENSCAGKQGCRKRQISTATSRDWYFWQFWKS